MRGYFPHHNFEKEEDFSPVLFAFGGLAYGKVKALKESAALFHFLQSNGINSVNELHEKITAMQSDYYALRGEIVGAEREIATLTKHLEMLGQYRANKAPKTDSEQALIDSAIPSILINSNQMAMELHSRNGHPIKIA